MEVRRNGSTWVVGDDDLDAELSRAFGDPVRVLAEADVPYFDDGPVSLVGTASLEWCRRELGVDADPRRTRTNLVLETTQPFEEETWAGRRLRIGSVELSVDRRLERCRMVDLAQDGVATTTPMLKALGASRDVCLAMLTDVSAPGHLKVGDVVTVTLTPQPGPPICGGRGRDLWTTCPLLWTTRPTARFPLFLWGFLLRGWSPRT